MNVSPRSSVVAGLLPSQCEICREWGATPLCAACVACFAAAQPRCQRCGLRTGVALPRCGDCLHQAPSFERTICVADYAFPWDTLIGALKFHGRPELAASLAPLLVDAVRASGTELPQLLLPVPMSDAALSARGYNQAWELARRVAVALGLPKRSDLLLRPLDTPHQIELGRAARQRNLRSAFIVDPRLRSALGGRHVAVIDDVMTTGATAQAAAATLLRAGAARVDVWVLARTSQHRGGD